MKIYIQQFYSAVGQIKTREEEVEVKFRSAVSSITTLPRVASERDARLTLDTKHLYVYINNAWHDQGVFDTQEELQSKLMQLLS